MMCICFPWKRYDSGDVIRNLRGYIFENKYPKNPYTKTIYRAIQRSIDEHNKQSKNPCYYYLVKIIRAHGTNWSVCKDIYEVTIGLTTIKKSKVPWKYVIFPSCFEVDKTMREDIVIYYGSPGRYIWGNRDHEEITFQSYPYEQLKSNKRLNYLAECHSHNIQPDYQFNFLIKWHFCPLCLINHAKLLF